MDGCVGWWVDVWFDVLLDGRCLGEYLDRCVGR